METERVGGSRAAGALWLAAPTPPAPRAPVRVTVLAPRSGAIVLVGHPVLICWQTSCLAGLVFHYVQLSTDGGATYPRDLSPLLDGQEHDYLWSPTEEVVTETARIRVVAVNWGEAVSDGLFSIRRAAAEALGGRPGLPGG